MTRLVVSPSHRRLSAAARRAGTWLRRLSAAAASTSWSPLLLILLAGLLLLAPDTAFALVRGWRPVLLLVLVAAFVWDLYRWWTGRGEDGGWYEQWSPDLDDGPGDGIYEPDGDDYFRDFEAWAAELAGTGGATAPKGGAR